MVSKNSELDFAALVDLLASEYGWTLDEISKLDFNQVRLLLGALYKRKLSQVADVGSSLPSKLDKLSKKPSSQDEIKAFLRLMGVSKKELESGKKKFRI